MGGYGSGRWERTEKKTTVDACQSIDIRRWHKDGLLVPGTLSRVSWVPFNAEETETGVLALIGQVLLFFMPLGGTSKEPIQQRIQIASTPCTYGGDRPWFVCPDCGRRAAKLYWLEQGFLCRHCADLVYESQREDKEDRLIHKAQTARKRLGGSANLLLPLPSRPKGMHPRKYNRLYCGADCLTAEAIRTLCQTFRSSCKRLISAESSC